MCGRYHIPNNPQWPARYRATLSAAQAPSSLRATDLRSLDTITGPPLQNFDRELNLSGTTPVDHSHVPTPSSSSPPPSLLLSSSASPPAPRLLDPQSVFQGRGSLPVARVPNLPKYGALRSRGPSRSTAQLRRVCLAGFRKQQESVALAAADRSYSRSGLLLGHNNQGRPYHRHFVSACQNSQTGLPGLEACVRTGGSLNTR